MRKLYMILTSTVKQTPLNLFIHKMNIDFKKTVNTKKVNKLSLAQLTALNNLLDGKATKKDYKILKNAK